MKKGKQRDVTGEMIVWPLERLSRLIRAREHGDDLNPAQWEALRYLARANRISNSPGALTQYLGATKGTISQTVKALERKGYVGKAEREGEKRSVTLTVTAKGQEALTRDPWSKLAKATTKLGSKTRPRLAKGLRELLDKELKRGGHKSFGLCATCRFFREKGLAGNALGPHQCMLLAMPLSAAESQQICVEHEAD
jgi:DNA-binding MarR family transcriptional regulator